MGTIVFGDALEYQVAEDQHKTSSITILLDDSKAMEDRRRLFISYFFELLKLGR